ncbi:23484_t:CDS:2 [Dentiscutata erythropus]|uniref:23484_t:CDS:1 n=1 Tax=Dentiscutata erythropus TaxID=1348616 RepID=A0A9N8ZEF5_9GLOM|nr:23484_t:CDS:2 [Dentiscutata erythropus]
MNNPQRKQNAVEKQLAVVLYRLGGKATIWDIVLNSELQKALKDLKKDVIWPRGDYRQKVHKGFEEIHVHDAKVFRNSSLYHCRNQLFEETDYVLADSAYPISLNIIPSFKDPSGLDKNRKIAFNQKHSKSRVVVEQAFGRLKKKNEDEWEEPSEQISMHRIQFNDIITRRGQAIKEAGNIKRQNLIDIMLS